METMSQTTKYAIGILIFFVVSMIVAALTFYYLNQEGTKLDSQMEVVGKSQLLQDRYNSLLSLVKKSEAEHTALASHLLTESETIKFLTEIESLAQRMSLRLSTDSLEPSALAGTDFQKIDLRLTLQGKKPALVQYLTILETLPYYSRIMELDFRVAQGTENGNWIATVSLMVGLQGYDQ